MARKEDSDGHSYSSIYQRSSHSKHAPKCIIPNYPLDYVYVLPAMFFLDQGNQPINQSVKSSLSYLVMNTFPIVSLSFLQFLGPHS